MERKITRLFVTTSVLSLLMTSQSANAMNSPQAKALQRRGFSAPQIQSIIRHNAVDQAVGEAGTGRPPAAIVADIEAAQGGAGVAVAPGMGAGGGGGAAPPPPPPPFGGPPPPPPPGAPPPPGGMPVGHPGVPNTPLGTMIMNLHIPGVTRAIAENASTAVAGAHVAATPHDKGVLARTSVNTDIHHLAPADQTKVERTIEAHFTREALPAGGNDRNVFNALVALPANVNLTVANADLITRAVVAPGLNQAQVGAAIDGLLPAANPAQRNQVKTAVSGVLFPPPPVVGVATANIGDAIPSVANAQGKANLIATITHFGDAAIDAAIAGNPVANQVDGVLAAIATVSPVQRRRAAYAVLTAPAATGNLAKRNRVVEMCDVPAGVIANHITGPLQAGPLP